VDRSVSALLDDLDERGLLDSTLVVMAGEFGRTPKISHLPAHYAKPGRDHWGAVQSVMLGGCGFDGGKIIGATDNQGGQPIDDRKSAENLAATMYSALGIPRETHWYDHQDRPLGLYGADPILA
jgi:arylsulfatase A-like enzyme